MISARARAAESCSDLLTNPSLVLKLLNLLLLLFKSSFLGNKFVLFRITKLFLLYFFIKDNIFVI
jgi:hypothetical protein